MKTIILLTIFVCFFSATQCYSQSITLSLKQVSLEKTFKEIRKQTGYTFVYTREQINKSNPVSINIKDASLNQALDICFTNQPLTFIIEDRHIIVKDRPDKTNALPGNVGIDIKGIVVNEQNEPVVGATVTVKGSEIATATDENGGFVLSSVNEEGTLIVTSIGYVAKEVKLNCKTNLLIRLKISIGTLDETVLIAYGKTTKRLNTGNVSKITSEEISGQPISNPLAALEGRVPGLVVTQTSGMPGGNFNVQIRGRNSLSQGSDPLFIIDGVPFAANNTNLNQLTSAIASYTGQGLSPFNSLTPSDIESIEILKDADATSIYGSRGANGVVLITTKKGKAGKTTLTTNVSTGFSKVTRTMDMLNTKEYLQMRREAFKNDGETPDIYSAPDLLLWDTTRYTNFKNLILGGTARC